MGPNDVELVRVFTARTGANVADITFRHDQPFEVVVEAEAGAAKILGGEDYSTSIVVQDVSDFTVIAGVAPASFSGNVGDATWPNRDQVFRYTVPAPGAAKENHVWQVVAWLRVGIGDPDVSFAISPLFIITRP